MTIDGAPTPAAGTVRAGDETELRPARTEREVPIAMLLMIDKQQTPLIVSDCIRSPSSTC